MQNNKMKLQFLSLSENEAFARSAVACFSLGLNPNIAEISDIKTAVSEAVTNCIVHGYPDRIGEITIESEIDGNEIHINVSDSGVGIADVEKAIEPFYTTVETGERSGMGFTIMRSFMDDVEVKSTLGGGTKVYMVKKILENVRENDA